jgi:hypothetical protein
VPDELAAASGLTKDHVRIKSKYGGGYPANVEGLHHLHCLNLLRKGLKWNYDYYRELGEGAFMNDEYIAKYHISKFSLTLPPPSSSFLSLAHRSSPLGFKFLDLAC